MPTRIVSSLSFQISAAFVVLLLLFAGAGLYALKAFEHQLAYDRVVDIAARLQLTAKQLHMQAMNYEENAPRDYPTYYRDVRLYYQDLMAHVETFDRVVDTFMSGDFRAPMGSRMPWLGPSVSPEVTSSIQRLEQTWSEYRRGLFDALGPDAEEPRLEYAAEHNIARHAPLERASQRLTVGLRQWTEEEHLRVRRLALAVLALCVVFSLMVLATLHAKALAPLKGAIAGFHRVADGDFGHQLPVTGATETRALTRSFNQLSARLDLLFQLIGRLQQGNNLDEVIGFLGREFPGLLRIDWIGVLLVGADGVSAQLESSAMDGELERDRKQLFPLPETLLAKALERGEPMRIEDMEATAERHRRYRFLRSLAHRGLKDAVLLPLTPQTQTPVPAVVVFASRSRGSYDGAQMRFLGNIAQLITHSFARTVRLTEHARLAAIGEFASTIAHELRTPLTTVGLALEHLNRQELPEKAAKRLQLAAGESARMRRLLEEILLYAKPLRLDLKVLDLAVFVARHVEESQALASARRQRLQIAPGPGTVPIRGDEDRMRQILSNLTQNACEAAPEGAVITWRVRAAPSSRSASAEIHNPGAPIPPGLLARVMEPFFSTKQGGTGLGLAIVKRLTELQGGEVSVTSSAQEGTRATIALPQYPGADA